MNKKKVKIRDNIAHIFKLIQFNQSMNMHMHDKMIHNYKLYSYGAILIE